MRKLAGIASDQVTRWLNVSTEQRQEGVAKSDG